MNSIEIDNGSRRFLDRAARHIDRRPAVLREKLARIGDFLGDDHPVDIGRIALRLQGLKPVQSRNLRRPESALPRICLVPTPRSGPIFRLFHGKHTSSPQSLPPG